MSTQSELALENKLIDQLQQLGWDEFIAGQFKDLRADADISQA
ncbi:MAG: hypothetical protein ACSHX6_09415 [Akkermansiaceae bacterium]